MNSRRDILKYFGAGAIIAPAVGAAPIARLIEPARVELAEAPGIIEPIDLSKVKSISLSLEMEDGTHRSMSAHPYQASGYADPQDNVYVKFVGLNLSSPSVTYGTGEIRAQSFSFKNGRCPYCRSVVVGLRCSSCGASA